MKISNVLWLTGGALIVGTAIYVVYKHYQNRTSRTVSYKSNVENNPEIISKTPNSNLVSGEIVLSDFERSQYETSNSIKDRHNIASHHLIEILGEMGNNNLEFEKKINQVNDDLDDLMK